MRRFYLPGYITMKKISRIKYTLIFVFIMPFVINAQSANGSFKKEFQFTLGLNSYYALEFEPSLSYLFHKNIGVVGGVRGVQEVVENYHYDLVGGPDYQWRASNKKKVSSLLLRPALFIKIPIFEDWVSIVTQPGMLVNLIPNETLEFAYINTNQFEFPSKFETKKNKGGQILFYELKSYLSVSLDNWSFLLGYNLSTYDIYSGRRNIVIGDELNKHLPKKKDLVHAGFIGFGYSF